MTQEMEPASAFIRDGVDKAEAEVAKCEAALTKQESALAQLEAERTARELELPKGPLENAAGQEDARMAQIQLEILEPEGDLIQRKKDLVLEKYRLLFLRSIVANCKQEAAQLARERRPDLLAAYENAKRENAQANEDFHGFFSQVRQAVVLATNYESLLLLMQKTGVPAETAVQALGLSAKDSQPILACLERTHRTVRSLSSSPSI